MPKLEIIYLSTKFKPNAENTGKVQQSSFFCFYRFGIFSKIATEMFYRELSLIDNCRICKEYCHIFNSDYEIFDLSIFQILVSVA